MRITIEIPRNSEQPSQGRNPGSIPGGSATAPSGLEDWLRTSAFKTLCGDDATEHLVEGRYYRTLPENPLERSAFVFFIGRTASRDALVFEDGEGDLHLAGVDEITIKSAP